MCSCVEYSTELFDLIICWCLPMVRLRLLEMPLLVSLTHLCISPKYKCTLYSCLISRSFRNPLEPSILCTTPPIELDVLSRRKPPWLMTTWNWMTCWVSSETSGTRSVGSPWKGEMFFNEPNVWLLCRPLSDTQEPYFAGDILGTWNTSFAWGTPLVLSPPLSQNLHWEGFADHHDCF